MEPVTLVSLLIISLFAVLTVSAPSIIDEHIETLLLDYRFKVRNFLSPPPLPDDILIVAIDEKSLAEYGRWPWTRKLQAELIERVFEGRPRVVALDIFYPESESPEADRILAEAIRRHKGSLVVALGFEAGKGMKFGGEIEEALFEQAIPRIENLKHLRALEAYRALLPPEEITSSALFGHVYPLPDRDGKLRWEILYIKYGDEYFPSLSLQAARIARGIAADDMRIVGGVGVNLGGRLIPTDEFGRLQINYIGREGSIPYMSAADVLSGRIPTRLFRDKIIFIGATAISTYDLKITPFSANMPGSEKNATVVANILRENFIKTMPLLDLIVVLLAGVSVFLISRKQRALLSLTASMLLSTFIVIANQVVFTYLGWRINLIYPLLTVIGIGIFITTYKNFIEEKKARYVRKMFSSYATERVVNELIKNPDMAKLGGDRREITVLFADIKQFTSFSERHEPEEVVALLNEYLTAMTEVIFRWEGTLDKFVGDAIIVFWGAPLRQPDHTELAVRCALNMIERLKGLQQEWRSKGMEALDIGIGINTGEVLVGNIGAEGKKMDYTVIGDHVNLCARVESLTREYNAHILITDFVYEKIMPLVREGRIGHIDISIEGLGKAVVKGKQKPVMVYEVRPSAHALLSVTEEKKEKGFPGYQQGKGNPS